MLVTLCTIRQLPQAIALGDSFSRHTNSSDGQLGTVLIGLADNPANLPTGFTSPYPIVPVSDILPTDGLKALSATYTPTEFVAACKPALIRHIFQQYSQADRLIYADPNVWFTASLTPVWTALSTANALLTPHITQTPAEGAKPGSVWPDEKFFQNIGLYSADFLAFRRSVETDRLLNWWQERVTERAFIDPCAGLWTDQIWLMHVPVFFREITIIKDLGWHVALWNLPERRLRPNGSAWMVSGANGQDYPLQFINVKGMLNPDEGYFTHQNRISITERPDAQTLLNAYRTSLGEYQSLLGSLPVPAYGQQTEPVVLRGWRRAAVHSLRAVAGFIDQMPLPVIR